MSLWPGEPTGPVYTVADAIAGLRQHPGQWVGHTVMVRGVAIDYGVGSVVGPGPAQSWSVPILLDPVPPAGPHHRIGPVVFMATLTQAAGRVRVHFNAPGRFPTLILRGAAPSGPTPIDGARQFIAQLAAWFGTTRRTNTYSPIPFQPRVYRVQLFAPARCPVSLASPCYTAVVR